MTTSTNDLRAAAEYVLQCSGSFDGTTDSGHCKAVSAWDCAQVCARSVLAEHAADDDEPVTIDWLNGLRNTDGTGLSMLRVRWMEDGTIRLMSPCNTISEGIDGLLDYVAPRTATRRDVRQLLRSLGVKTKETT